MSRNPRVDALIPELKKQNGLLNSKVLAQIGFELGVFNQSSDLNLSIERWNRIVNALDAYDPGWRGRPAPKLKYILDPETNPYPNCHAL